MADQAEQHDASEALVGVGVGASARKQAYEGQQQSYQRPTWAKAAALTVGSALLLAGAAFAARGSVALHGPAAPGPSARLGLWAAPGQGSGTTLFCWLVMRSEGYEQDIMLEQYKRRAGIFACDDQSVFSDAAVRLGSDFVTTNIGTLTSQMGGAGPLATGSWVNTGNFFRAWSALRASRAYQGYDWVVKTDPDTVLLPDLLRQHLLQRGAGPAQGIYFMNCPNVDNGFYGSMEVVSQAAFQKFMGAMDGCKASLQYSGWGEDLFNQKCMDSVGVQRQGLYDLVTDGACHGPGNAPSCVPGRPAYHPLKSAASWVACQQQAEGQAAAGGVAPVGGSGMTPFWYGMRSRSQWAGSDQVLPNGKHRFPIELVDPSLSQHEDAAEGHAGWLPGFHRRK